MLSNNAALQQRYILNQIKDKRNGCRQVCGPGQKNPPVPPALLNLFSLFNRGEMRSIFNWYARPEIIGEYLA